MTAELVVGRNLAEMMAFQKNSNWATRMGHQMVQKRAVLIRMEMN
jgi:hypothetical protein